MKKAWLQCMMLAGMLLLSACQKEETQKVTPALAQETKGRTTLIVAQRVSTIMNADQIIVLEDGKIVGKGTHKELLKTCKVYEEIARSQLSEEEIAQ